MTKKITLLLAMLALTAATQAGDKIKYYFNFPVDNTVATGENAVYLNRCMGDTLVAYINRANSTLDIAVYNYTSTFPAISVAINSAYSRGVKVRWIYDGAQSNTGLPSLNASIPKLGSPTTSAYTIMHNKFMIVDVAGPAPIVWTGSANWNNDQFNNDHNNVVILQDALIASAYLAQFNMMWGSSGLTPNLSTSKFGQFKTDLGSHEFTVEGKRVEVYFSPADGTNSKIQASINSAHTDLYFGMYTFTDNTDATAIISKHYAGVYTAGIIDNSSSSNSAYTSLRSALGSNFIGYAGGADLFHNKYLIVDPSNTCSDPLVLTGSHNWSISANTKNDENTLIIHDATAANVFYQSFKGNFTGLGGSLAMQSGCNTSVSTTGQISSRVTVFPNPAANACTIRYEVATASQCQVSIYNSIGQKLTTTGRTLQTPGTYEFAITLPSGVYVAVINMDGQQHSERFIVN